MKSKKLAAVKAPSREASSPTPAPPPMDAASERILEDVRALCEELLPPDHATSATAEDWYLATATYLETHPLMQERVHALRSKELDESGVVPVAAPQKRGSST